jgi:hypothetical protein
MITNTAVYALAGVGLFILAIIHLIAWRIIQTTPTLETANDVLRRIATTSSWGHNQPRPLSMEPSVTSPGTENSYPTSHPSENV